MGSIVRMRRLTLVSCLAIISSLLVADVAAGANPSSQAGRCRRPSRRLLSAPTATGAIAAMSMARYDFGGHGGIGVAGTSMRPCTNDHIRAPASQQRFSGAAALAWWPRYFSLDETIGQVLTELTQGAGRGHCCRAVKEHTTAPWNSAPVLPFRRRSLHRSRVPRRLNSS